MSSYYEVQNPTKFNIKPITPYPPFTPTIPVGSVISFAGSVAPEQYFLCDGSTVSRIRYPALFEVIGEMYGAGDGTTTFNLPNLQGRIPVGQLAADPYFNAMASAGGVTDVTLTTAQIPSHDHTSNAVGGQGNLGLCIADGTNTATVADSSLGELNVFTTPRALTINNSGGGGSHTNVQPYVVMNYIIKY